jgi:hypothetical protein
LKSVWSERRTGMGLSEAAKMRSTKSGPAHGGFLRIVLHRWARRYSASEPRSLQYPS